MYQWVGTALRQSIVARFNVDEQALGAAVHEVVDGIVRPTPPAKAAVDQGERDEMERRLIDKLQAAGQLRAGLLIRAVREKRLSLFTHGLSALGGFSDEQVRRALSASSPEALYYACAAVGIDRRKRAHRRARETVFSNRRIAEHETGRRRIHRRCHRQRVTHA